MNSWRLKIFNLKKSKQHLLLLFIFCAFSLVQVSSIEHQNQHQTGTDESTCVLCLNTPDNLIATSPAYSIDLVFDTIVYKIGQSKSAFSSHSNNYLARGPPLFC